MQVLIDEDKRAIGMAPDDMEWSYPDNRWMIVSVPNDAEVISGLHDMVHYIYDGTEFKYDPKQYDNFEI